MQARAQFTHAVEKTGYKAKNAYGSTTPLDAMTYVSSRGFPAARTGTARVAAGMLTFVWGVGGTHKYMGAC